MNEGINQPKSEGDGQDGRSSFAMYKDFLNLLRRIDDLERVAGPDKATREQLVMLKERLRSMKKDM